MFKKDLIAKFERIFEMEKVTFDAPSDKFEQDTIFVNVTEVFSRAANKKMNMRINGTIQIFSEHEKLPFGFMARMLEKAKLEDKKDLFFFSLDQEVSNSPARMVNISERQAKFVFLFSKQYNPNQGTMTSVVLGEPEAI